ncbi:hypothetical protein Tco_0000760 [Tanacetum coccineum]
MGLVAVVYRWDETLESGEFGKMLLFTNGIGRILKKYTQKKEKYIEERGTKIYRVYITLDDSVGESYGRFFPRQLKSLELCLATCAPFLQKDVFDELQECLELEVGIIFKNRGKHRFSKEAKSTIPKGSCDVRTVVNVRAVGGEETEKNEKRREKIRVEVDRIERITIGPRGMGDNGVESTNGSKVINVCSLSPRFHVPTVERFEGSRKLGNRGVPDKQYHFGVGIKLTKNAGPQETNGNIGLKKNVNAGQIEEENMSTQQYIVFPLWSSISSSYKSSHETYKNDTADDVAGESLVQKPASENEQALKNVLDKMMDQEKEAKEQSDAVRKESEA